jgi:dTDP-4-amino-4,6-dideoxygalactose transaminase
VKNAYDVVRDFEQAIAEYAGAKHGVATDSCSSAILLSLLFRKQNGQASEVIMIPCRTYPSVPMAVVHSGSKIRWLDHDWQGIYWLNPAVVVDGAKRFRKNMYAFGGRDTLWCCSFHAKKILPIGRGGMILTDDAEAAAWLRKARFDGRDEKPLWQQEDSAVIGYNCYMEPSSAARGLLLLSHLPDDNLDQTENPPYPDLSKWRCFAGHTA